MKRFLLNIFLFFIGLFILFISFFSANHIVLTSSLNDVSYQRNFNNKLTFFISNIFNKIVLSFSLTSEEYLKLCMSQTTKRYKIAKSSLEKGDYDDSLYFLISSVNSLIKVVENEKVWKDLSDEDKQRFLIFAKNYEKKIKELEENIPPIVKKNVLDQLLLNFDVLLKSKNN